MIVAALLVSACATADREAALDRSVSEFSAERPATLDEVSRNGWRAAAAYLRDGERLRERRSWINLGMLAANTFVTAAAGLDAHADSIFAGSMVGNTLFGLDANLNAGGAAAWSTAFMRTTCVIGFVDMANSVEIRRDVAILQAAGTPESAEAWSNYRKLVTTAHTAIAAAYVEYVTSRTPELIEPAATEPAAAPEPARTFTPAQVQEAIVRVNAISSAATAGIQSCALRATPGS